MPLKLCCQLQKLDNRDEISHDRSSILYGLSKSQIVKFQPEQNASITMAAARLVLNLRKYLHITPILYELHWLLVQHGVHFKIKSKCIVRPS